MAPVRVRRRDRNLRSEPNEEDREESNVRTEKSRDCCVHMRLIENQLKEEKNRASTFGQSKLGRSSHISTKTHTHTHANTTSISTFSIGINTHRHQKFECHQIDMVGGQVRGKRDKQIERNFS